MKKENSKPDRLTNRFRKPARRKLPGEIPGTAIHTGIQRLEHVLMTVHDFDSDHYESISINKIEKSEPYIQHPSKTWIQVRGLHDIERLRTVWDYFSLHPLVQEDIVSTSQRPKVEIYPDHIFVVLKMITHQPEENPGSQLHIEQISIVVGKNFVLSFQESDDPVFDPILKRLETKTTRLRKLGPDYLSYALIDTVIDHYFQALDELSESLDILEETVLDDPKPVMLQKIHSLRRDLIYFRKTIWPLRDGINSLIRDDLELISDDVKVYLKDCYDHIIQIVDIVETNREIVFGLFDIYMSSLSNRMSEVMKLLTIIATIFIPLTFIAGIYGMNFNTDVSPFNMPELNWYYGYPISLLLMAGITAAMLYYFRRRKWI